MVWGPGKLWINYWIHVCVSCWWNNKIVVDDAVLKIKLKTSSQPSLSLSLSLSIPPSLLPLLSFFLFHKHFFITNSCRGCSSLWRWSSRVWASHLAGTCCVGAEGRRAGSQQKGQQCWDCEVAAISHQVFQSQEASPYHLQWKVRHENRVSEQASRERKRERERERKSEWVSKREWGVRKKMPMSLCLSRDHCGVQIAGSNG